MWLFTSQGFLSIVAHRDMQGFFLVRARRRSHLVALLPNAEIIHHRDADYPFRCLLSLVELQECVMHQLQAIDYDNYKNSILEDAYHDVCLDVWRTMWAYGFQFRKEGSQ